MNWSIPPLNGIVPKSDKKGSDHVTFACNRLTLPRLTLIALGVVVMTLPALSKAHAEPRITISAFGQYETRSSGRVIKRPKTASGVVSPISQKKLVRKDTQIFGQLGRSFGVELDLSGFPSGAVTLTIRTLHPPLTNPKTGKTTRVSEYDWPVTGRRKVYFGFTFDATWEIAEGAWAHQFFYKGKLLAQKKFKVVVPLN